MLTADLVANVIVTSVFLSMLRSLGGAGTFAVLGAVALLALMFCYRLAPETNGRQLEDIGSLLSLPAERKWLIR